MRFALSSFILVLELLNVNSSLPDNLPPKEKEALLAMARYDFPKFKNIIEFNNPKNLKLTAEDFAKLGNALYKKEYYEDALWNYTTAYELNPHTLYKTWQKLCRIGEKNVNVKSDTAIALLRRVVLIDPDSTSVQTDLMDALWESGKFDDIVKSALLLLDYQNLLDLGERYMMVNKFDEAIHCYNEGLNKSFGNDKDLLLARAMCYLRMSRLDTFDKAVSDFTSATKDSQTDFWTYYDFIDVMFSAQKFRGGLQAIWRRLKLDEDTLNKLADTFLREQRFQHAIHICDEALTRNDVFKLPFYRRRATCYMKLGSEYRALDDLRSAYNMLQSKTDPRIQEVLDKSPSTVRSEIVYDLVSTLNLLEQWEEATNETHKLDETDFKYVVGMFLSRNEFKIARLICDRGTDMSSHSKELQSFLEYCAMRIKESEKQT